MSAHPTAADRPTLDTVILDRTTQTPSRGVATWWPRLVAGFQYAIFPFAVWAVWHYLSANELVPANVLPSPGGVAQSFVDLVASGELAEHLGISLRRVVQGAALGLTLGLALGVAMGTSRSFESWVGPTFRVAVQVPSIALIPLLMMILGIDDALKLFIMVKACVIPLALIVADGIRNIPKAHIEACEVLCLRRSTVYRKVILPAALPSVFTGLRQGLAHVWVALVAVEVLASADGMGYLITWSRLIFQIDVVLVCIAVIGVIGFVLDTGMRKLEAHLLQWKETQR